MQPGGEVGEQERPERRVSRPTMNGRSMPKHHPPHDRSDDEVGSEVGVRVAADAVGTENAARPGRRVPGPGCYRFEYCGALRAFFNPYLRRSFSRASRVRRPAFLSDGRVSGSSATSARAMPSRIAPA